MRSESVDNQNTEFDDTERDKARITGEEEAPESAGSALTHGDEAATSATDDIAPNAPIPGAEAPPFGSALRTTETGAYSDPSQPTPPLWTQLDQKAAHKAEKGEKAERGLMALFIGAIVLSVALIAAGIAMLHAIRSKYPSQAYSYGAKPSFEYGAPGTAAPDDRYLIPGDPFGEGRRAQEKALEEENATPTLAPTPKPKRPTYTMPVIGSQKAGSFDPNHLFADISAFVSPSVVMIASELPSVETMTSFGYGGYTDGSGIVLSRDGFIVTNSHVVVDSQSIAVRFQDSDEVWEAEIVGSDPIRDLAVLKVERKNCTAAVFGDSDELRPGDIAIAIGNALGEGSGTTTQGIISATKRKLTLDSGHRQEFIQTDAAINPGNSGGALVNDKGEVIGINTLKYTVAGMDETGGSIPAEGIGYAIPINDVMPIIEKLILDGEIKRPALGVSVSDGETVPEIKALLEKMGAPAGVYVAGTVKGGPAEKAGIRRDDVITAIDGKPMKTVEALTDEIAGYDVGGSVELTVWRDGKTIKLKVDLIDMNALDYRE